MNSKKNIIICFMIFINFFLSSNSFGNPQFFEISTMTSEMTPEIKEFLKLKEIYEQELTSIEVVGREKSEKEEKRSQKIKRILFHLNHILKTLKKNDSFFP